MSYEATPLTEADFYSWRFMRDAMHLNGGKEWFGWGHQCIDQPRLLVIDKYFKNDRKTKRSYLVDGRTQCETLSDALSALSKPVEVSPDDVARLRALPLHDWIKPERRVDLVDLGRMGLIEWGRDAENKVTCRLTDAGRNAVTSAQGE